jgi:hypothetical protein
VGGTYFGHQNFSLGYDAARKMGFGHYTLYAKGIKQNYKYVVQGFSVCSNGYLGGHGHDYADVMNRRHHTLMARQDGSAPSIIAIPVHIREQTEDEDAADVTGAFSPSLYDPDGRGHTSRRSCPRMARTYADAFGIRQRSDPRNRDLYGGAAPSNWNTIMTRGTTVYFNPATKKFDIEVLDQGHWGTAWYPGCVAVHHGKKIALDYDRHGPFSQGATAMVRLAGALARP